MPVARYFLWVGGVLLALLFIANACLPKLPEGRATDTPRPVIRIYSERKWPERIVFDTSTPMLHMAAAASPVQVAKDLDGHSGSHARSAGAVANTRQPPDTSKGAKEAGGPQPTKIRQAACRKAIS